MEAAFSNPKVYVANYCYNLCNKIDIQFESYRQQEGVSNDLLKYQDLMIDELKLFQQECLSKRAFTKKADRKLLLMDKSAIFLTREVSKVLFERLFDPAVYRFDYALIFIDDLSFDKVILDYNGETESIFNNEDLKLLFLKEELTKDLTNGPIKHVNLRLSEKELIVLNGCLFKRCYVRLAGDLFDDLPHLKEIYFNSNGVISIEPRTFQDHNNLNKICLQFNQITDLESNTFKGLHNLRELVLNNNKLVHIDPKWFQDLCNLENLILGGNLITKLENNVFKKLTSLKQLHLECNTISEIQPNAFIGLNKLTCLFISHNRLTGLDSNAFKELSSLKELNLNNNLLSSIDSNTISCLKNMEKIRLDSNKLTGLDSNLFHDLVKLKTISLSNNLIDSLDFNVFDGLVNLEEILLDRNELTSLNKTILSGLTNLTEIDLSNNKLSLSNREELKIVYIKAKFYFNTYIST